MLKNYSLVTGLVILVAMVMSSPAWAVPPLINFQGKVTDGDGVALDGFYMMQFFLCYEASGGSCPWTEEQTVEVTGGIYNVQLGAEEPFSVILFDSGELYLEVMIFSSGSGWEALSPRQHLTSTPFAIKAGVADVALDADTLDGMDSTELDQTGHVADTGNPHSVTAAQTGAVSQSDLTAHASNSSAHHAKTTSFTELTDTAADSQIPGTITRDTELSDGLAGKADAAHNHDTRYYTQAQVDAIESNLQNQINDLKALLANVTRIGNDITFSGVNVHIVNGTGTTDGEVDGLGNLIVGYNETRGSGDDRTGSHNIVVGSYQNYSSYGGLVAGSWNTISGYYSSVSGGRSNTASGGFASVSGGEANIASNLVSSVSGGYYNAASGDYSSVSGGYRNAASGYYSSVSGGDRNAASGNSSSVSGGSGNEASADYSSISGGNSNVASGNSSSVSGGYYNAASGDYSSASGGFYNAVRGDYSSVSGGDTNAASGDYSSVSGGVGNEASAYYSSVSGGLSNAAEGEGSSVNGGDSNRARGDYASVSGGFDNDASGPRATVTGGAENTAAGSKSTVSGGSARTSASTFDWRAGAYFQDQ